MPTRHTIRVFCRCGKMLEIERWETWTEGVVDIYVPPCPDCSPKVGKLDGTLGGSGGQS